VDCSGCLVLAHAGYNEAIDSGFGFDRQVQHVAAIGCCEFSHCGSPNLVSAQGVIEGSRRLSPYVA
jgi:hypothetical protein